MNLKGNGKRWVTWRLNVVYDTLFCVNKNAVRGKGFRVQRFFNPLTIRNEESQMTSYAQKGDKDKITDRLIRLILKMPKDKQLALLKILEEQKFKEKDRRKQERKPCFIAAECDVNGRVFSDIIKDISDGGIYIGTNAPYYVGQKILLTFQLPNNEDLIKKRCEVVRIDPNGIGLKFI